MIADMYHRSWWYLGVLPKDIGFKHNDHKNECTKNVRLIYRLENVVELGDSLVNIYVPYSEHHNPLLSNM